jgi:hypothetical protein
MTATKPSDVPASDKKFYIQAEKKKDFRKLCYYKLFNFLKAAIFSRSTTKPI